MADRCCEFCGDETGACRDCSPCEVRSDLIDAVRARRAESRIGRRLARAERVALADLRRRTDWLQVREGLRPYGVWVRFLGR